MNSQGPEARRRGADRRRRTNLALGGLLAGAVLTGLAANTVGTDQPVDLIAVHGVLGLGIVLLAPWKSAVVRSGWRRPGPGGAFRGRGWSVVLLAGVLAALVSGLAHGTGLVDRLGPLTVMQVHVGAAVVALAVLGLHLRRHPVRPKRVDLSRRALLGAAGLAALATAGWAGWDRAVAAAGPRASRRFTGSAERSSGDPGGLPVYSWIDDRPPQVDPVSWRMTVLGRPLGLADLARMPQDRVEAVLDCTGGWYSRQEWTGVRLDRLLAAAGAPLPDGTRSVQVRSSTGLVRRFPAEELDRVWLVTGLGGRPLTAGHGFPARLVAPHRRGFWWVKWVDDIRADPRPWWTQPPFPLT